MKRRKYDRAQGEGQKPLIAGWEGNFFLKAPPRLGDSERRLCEGKLGFLIERFLLLSSA